MEKLKKIREELVEQEHNLWDLYDELTGNLKVKSNAKTRTERIQEKVSLKIEITRIYNRIQVLSKVIDAFDTNISLSKYNLSTYSTHSSENLEKINQELSILLENEYKKLDTLSKKEILLQEFSTERRKGSAKYELGLAAAVGGVFGVCCIGIPFEYIANLPFSLTNLLLPIVVSAGVGAVGANNLQKKMVNENIEAFINLNSELGIDALPLEKDNNTKDEEREIEKSIDAQVQRLMIILMNQKEVQRLIEVSNGEKCEIDSINTLEDATVLEKLSKEQIDALIAYNSTQQYSIRIPRMDSECFDENEMSQEQSGPVKKLTPTKK